MHNCNNELRVYEQCTMTMNNNNKDNKHNDKNANLQWGQCITISDNIYHENFAIMWMSL